MHHSMYVQQKIATLDHLYTEYLCFLLNFVSCCTFKVFLWNQITTINQVLTFHLYIFSLKLESTYCTIFTQICLRDTIFQKLIETEIQSSKISGMVFKYHMGAEVMPQGWAINPLCAFHSSVSVYLPQHRHFSCLVKGFPRAFQEAHNSTLCTWQSVWLHFLRQDNSFSSPHIKMEECQKFSIFFFHS